MARRKNRRNALTRQATNIDWSELSKLILSAMFLIVFIIGTRMIEDVPIRSIHVSSNIVRVSKIEISEIVQRYEMAGFFTVNLSNFEDDLNNLGWVYKANIKRQWPYKLIIELEEQIPIFRWNEQQLLNKYGHVFSANSNESFDHRPELRGEPGRALYLANLYEQYSHQFAALDISITSLHEDARYDKVMILSNDVRLNMGRGDVAQQMQHCLRALALLSAKERSAIATIDLRHSNGLAVSWDT